MKKRVPIILMLISFIVLPALAQLGRPGMGGPPKGANLSGRLSKLFGDHPGFSATMEIQTAITSDENVTYPGKVAFADGNSRFEMDATKAKGIGVGNVAAQMQAMGMDKMIVISRPDNKLSYMILPGLKAYAEIPLKDSDVVKSQDQFKIESTEVAREKVDDHDCVKNRVVISDNEGNKHQLTAWNATDLNKFPVKIEQTEGGSLTTILFKDIKLTKPEANLFDPPSDMTRYTSYGEMVQKEMMKKYNTQKGSQKAPVPQAE